MKLENRFTVPVARDEAWKVLLDVERVAPCMPGASLTSRDGDSFTGQVKVKLGPINLTYSGKAAFVQLDEAGGVAVIEASGKETRGTGTARATITCRLVDRGAASTDIEVDTDLAITGKPAQFGRGVLADVSAKLVDQFAACLSEEIQQGTPSAVAPEGSAPPETAPEAAPVGSLAPETGQGTGPVPTPAPTGGALPVADVGPTSAPQAGPPPVSATDLAVEQAGAGAPGLSAGPAAAEATATGTGAAAASGSDPASPRAPRQQAEAIDLLGTAGAPVLKRVGPALAVVALLVVVVRRLLR